MTGYVFSNPPTKPEPEDHDSNEHLYVVTTNEFPYIDTVWMSPHSAVVRSTEMGVLAEPGVTFHVVSVEMEDE